MGSSPNWTYGYVPTAAQWNSEFSSKQDDLGYTPVNRAGDTMLGRLSTFASIPARSGFNIQPGTAPDAPISGDLWVDATGFYVQVGPDTVGPIGPGTVTSIGLSAPSQFAVTGSPVTGTGTLSLAWNAVPAHYILSGPTSGGSAVPTFRAFVATDLPSGAAVANLGYTPLNPANNLSDVASPATAAANIGAVSTAAVNTFTATQRWAKGADIASAAALTPGSDGNYFNVTGTTTVTSIASVSIGVWVKFHFNAALTLTNSANFVLPGSANITAAAGDEAEFVQTGASTWRCTSYTKFAGLGLNRTEVLSLLNASGASPVYAVRAWVNFNGTGSVAIRASGNVSSITDNGVGDYTVNFTTALQDANYSAVITNSPDYGVAQNQGVGLNANSATLSEDAPSASAVRFFTRSTSAYFDAKYVSVIVVR